MGAEAIAITLASTALSAASAAATGRQSRKIAEFQNAQQRLAYEKTLAVAKTQGEITSAERRRQIQGRYDAFKGASAVSAAERGVAGSRTQAAIMSSLGTSAVRESAKVSMEQQLGLQNLAISALPQWQVGQSTSPIFAGIQGGLSGLSMGMGIEQGKQSLDISKQMAAAQGIQIK